MEVIRAAQVVVDRDRPRPERNFVESVLETDFEWLKNGTNECPYFDDAGGSFYLMNGDDGEVY